jgi:drug/metabolite transporter (DMT)-like permease
VPASSLFGQNIPLALVLMVVSSLVFAGGVTIQHWAVGRTVDPATGSRNLALGQVLRLLLNPRWLAGIAVAGCGTVFHVTALLHAPVTVVQPVGILAVPWSVLLAAKLHGFRPTRRSWGAVAVTIFGIVVFTLISTRGAAPDGDVPPFGVVVGAVVIFAVAAVLAAFGRHGRPSLRCIWWASGGSCCYGLSTGLIKSFTNLLGRPDVFESPLFWLLAVLMVVCYAVGGWMIQQAYANGPAEIVVGSMTTTDPIIAVAFGLAVLGEGVRLGALDALGMAVSGAVAVAGVVVLSLNHPGSQANSADDHASADPGVEPDPVTT